MQVCRRTIGAQWAKRLRRILDELPGSQPQWHEVMTEEPRHSISSRMDGPATREEFEFLVRRAVADRLVSEEEHQRSTSLAS